MNVPAWASLPPTPTVVVAVSATLLVGVAGWVVALVRQRRRPAVAGWILAAVGGLLAWGGWLVVNSATHYDADRQSLTPRRNLVAWLPGGADVRVGALALLQTAAVLLTGLALADLARRPHARAAVVAAIAAAGGTVGTLGALDRFGVGPLRFRQTALSGVHFAVFDYHANAAAFLNLTLPAALAVAWRCWTRRAGVVHRAAATAAVAGVLAGCATHVSKAGQVLGAVTLAGAGIAAWRATVRSRGSARTATRARHVRRAVAATVFVVAVGASGVAGAADRWKALPTTVRRDNPRVLAVRVALHAVERAPLAGSGPGSFKLLLPGIVLTSEPEMFRHWVVQPYRRGAPTTMWMQAHDDPLQALVEWGVPGLVLGLVLFGAPMVLGVGALRRRRAEDPTFVLAGVGALTIVGLHGLVDFPLQVLPIQLVAAAWAAVVLGACGATASGQTDGVAAA